MTQEQYTIKRRKFQHLTREKRAQIEILLRQGLPKVQVAHAVGISRSTLYNELSRGTVEQADTNLKKYQRYFWDAGQRVYEENRKNSHPPMKIMKAYEFVRYAEKQILENKMSPDALCGEAKLSGRFRETVSTKTLYNYIDKCILKVRNIDLPLKVKRKSRADKCKQNKRLFGMSIEERGTNEKQNSLVRRFFPKGKSFDNITDEQVAFVENWINNLPRKIFNYQSADFIFKSVLFDIAI